MTSVSVVVVNYNHERFLRDALDSVFAQTLPVDQIILADDNSDDGSIELVRNVFPGVIVSINNFTRSPLLNALQGMKKANGDFIFFLDSDDVWHPSKIELCLKEFLANPTHIIVSHSHQRVDVNLSPVLFDDLTSRNIRQIFSGSASLIQSRLRESLLYRRGFWLGSAYGLRRSAFDIDKFSGFIESSCLSRYSYLDLTLAPYLAACNPSGTLGYLPYHTFLYRMHGSNSASSDNPLAQKAVVKRMMATTLLTSRLLSFAGQPRNKVVQSYLPTIFYYKYIVSIADRRFLASARYLFHSRSHLAAYPCGFAKEIVRLALFLVPGGHRIFYYGKKSLFHVMSGLGRFFNLF